MKKVFLATIAVLVLLLVSTALGAKVQAQGGAIVSNEKILMTGGDKVTGGSLIGSYKDVTWAGNVEIYGSNQVYSWLSGQGTTDKSFIDLNAKAWANRGGLAETGVYLWGINKVDVNQESIVKGDGAAYNYYSGTDNAYLSTGHEAVAQSITAKTFGRVSLENRAATIGAKKSTISQHIGFESNQLETYVDARNILGQYDQPAEVTSFSQDITGSINPANNILAEITVQTSNGAMVSGKTNGVQSFSGNYVNLLGQTYSSMGNGYENEITGTGSSVTQKGMQTLTVALGNTNFGLYAGNYAYPPSDAKKQTEVRKVTIQKPKVPKKH